ncbi:MAG: DUF6065 family protein [Bryobacteraceae bacterium]
MSGTAQVATPEARLRLVAYQTYAAPAMRIVPAPADRGWMDETGDQFAYRCLPLLIANQAGWHVLNSHRLRVTWDGAETINSVAVEYPEGWAPYPASTHFGHGIVTWTLPYLFRTPPGYNLLVRGPANLPKDGAYPLEGIVETDWAVGSFTMNWKLTRPGVTVTFEKDEPICMIVPQRRGEIESFDPEIRALEEDPELALKARAWAQSRSHFLEALTAPGATETWQKHYFQGTTPQGGRGEDHQTRLKLRHFSSSTHKL